MNFVYSPRTYISFGPVWVDFSEQYKAIVAKQKKESK